MPKGDINDRLIARAKAEREQAESQRMIDEMQRQSRATIDAKVRASWDQAKLKVLNAVARRNETLKSVPVELAGRATPLEPDDELVACYTIRIVEAPAYLNKRAWAQFDVDQRENVKVRVARADDKGAAADFDYKIGGLLDPEIDMIIDTLLELAERSN